MADSFPKYLERAKAKTNTKSDSNMARKIGVSRAHLCQCKAGLKFLSEDRMLDLARRADLDPKEALILLNFWKSHGAARKHYADLLKTFTVLVTCIGLFFSPISSPNANALINIGNIEAAHVQGNQKNVPVLNIMREAGKLLARLLHRIWRGLPNLNARRAA